MKRINWFKTVGLSAATFAAITPVVIMSTSCTVKKMTVDYFSYSTLKEAASGYSFTNYSTGNVDFENLLIGDLRITSGNFMIIVGSNEMGSTCKFFTGDTKVRRKSAWFNDYFANSILHNAITEDEKADKEKVPFTIFNIIDYCPTEYYDKKGKRLYLSTDGLTPNLDYVHPFRKWDATLIESTHKFNSIERKIGGGTYDWDKDSVSDKDYIRNDASAVAYRRFCELGAKLYPKDDKATPKREVTFSTDTSDSSRLVIFKEGKLKYLNNLPADGKTLANLINENFLKDQEEKK